MGGGAIADEPHELDLWGLSPRGRGSRRRGRRGGRGGGSIPAWAGEPTPTATPGRGTRVYPRVGGGAGHVIAHVLTEWGLFPAWAGEPPRPSPSRRAARVYPRVGGGALPEVCTKALHDGLSPRGRGSRISGRDGRFWCRSIPAWAGEPLSRGAARTTVRVYPRVGGGAGSSRGRRRTSAGLSPRGRGSLHRVAARRQHGGSIPAWAGEPRQEERLRATSRVYPRVGGGALFVTLESGTERGLSPRGRGSPRRHVHGRGLRGSIPAWAGEPTRRAGTWTASRVYPRVGGGAVHTRASPCPRRGLSPRGRGSRLVVADHSRGRRSIPAWAGEPTSR